MLILAYGRSTIGPDKHYDRATRKGGQTFARRRLDDFKKARQLIPDNFVAFDHVFIHASAREDLFDQEFGLLRSYRLSSSARR